MHTNTSAYIPMGFAKCQDTHAHRHVRVCASTCAFRFSRMRLRSFKHMSLSRCIPVLLAMRARVRANFASWNRWKRNLLGPLGHVATSQLPRTRQKKSPMHLVRDIFNSQRQVSRWTTSSFTRTKAIWVWFPYEPSFRWRRSEMVFIRQETWNMDVYWEPSEK
jgi:hypothetical protein